MRILCSLAFALMLLPTALSGADSLFDDPVVARAKSFEIRESHVHEAYIAQKAAAAALGQPQPPSLEARLKKQILERMIATKLLLARATPIDRETGERLGRRIIAENKEKAGSEASYRRRLLAVGSSPESFETEIIEQAIVQAVIDKDLKSKTTVTEQEINSFYQANLEKFTAPEKIRAAHILFATRKIPSGELLTADQRQAKKAAAERVLQQIRTGGDFDQLLKIHTEDPEVEKHNGEITFARGSGTVPASFEAAASSLAPGKISDVVTSVFGYHIIKVLEKTPAGPRPLDEVREQIRDTLLRERVQAQLPDYLARLRKEAAVEVLE